jgi:LysM repeat protein
MSHRRLRVTLLLLLAIGIAAVPIGWWPARPAQAQTELLINPGFEGPLVSQGNDVFVATGWQAWYVVPGSATYPTKCPEGSQSDPLCKPYHIPGYRNTQPQNARIPQRARSGDSQQWGTAWAIYIAGVYQSVNGVTPGMRLHFSAYTQGFNCDDDRGCFGGVGVYGMSYEPGDMQTRVGIDPTGGTNAFGAGVVWSGYANPLDAFVLQEVEAVAQSSTVTVFIWSSPTYPELHTDIYVDDASLIAVGQGAVPTTAATVSTPGTPLPTATLGTPQPTPTIPPNTGTYTIQSGDTLSAIAARYHLTLDQLLALNPSLTRESILQVGQVINIGGTPQPTTPTATPTATIAAASAPTATLTISTPVSTNTPAANGIPALANSGLCLSAFNDADGSGTREPAETGLVAGVRFDVANAQNQAVAFYTSDGVEKTHCLNNLPDGRYTVSITPPAGQTATTDLKWSVSVLSGANVNITFGSRVPPTAIATPEIKPTAQAAVAATPAPAARSTGVPLSLLVGGALVLLAIAALAFAVSSRRR